MPCFIMLTLVEDLEAFLNTFYGGENSGFLGLELLRLERFDDLIDIEKLFSWTGKWTKPV